MLLSKFNNGLEIKAAALAGKNQLIGGWVNDVLVVYVAYKTSLSFVRTEQKVLDPFGNTLSQGSIGAVSYNDFDLLETTNLNTATNYIENKLSDDLKMFKDGTLKVETKVVETKWLDSNELKKFDKQSLSAILNMRSYEVVEDENAADFLSGIKDDEDLGSDEKVNPILPL